MAFERLDLAISLFPNNSEFLLQKITALLKISWFEEAQNVVKTGKLRFPQDHKIALTEATIYQKQKNYHDAQKILEQANLDYPDNIEIKLELADNHLQLGELAATGQILETIKHRSGSKLSKQFNKSYLTFLVRAHKIDELKQYLQEIQSTQYQFDETFISNYCQLLASHGYYQDAYQFLTDFSLRNSGNSVKVDQTKIHCLFELEKITNLEKLSNVDPKTPLDTWVREANQSLQARLKTYLSDHSNFDSNNRFVKKKIDKLNYLYNTCKLSYLNTYTSPFDAYELTVKILDHIKNKIPLSLIRLGDGEGTFLDYDETFKDFQERDRDVAKKCWWGDVNLSGYDCKNLSDNLKISIKNADILGIPEYYLFFIFLSSNSIEKQLLEKNNGGGCRGLTAIINTLIDPKFYQEQDSYQLSHQTLTSCYIHQDLEVWGLYRLILNHLTECSVISCHEGISEVLMEKYGVTVKRLYQIPSESNYSQLFNYKDQENYHHYPYYFQKISSELTVSYPGEVFLVAAGFLGKIYCNSIKNLGGIALDVGSIVDYWLNYSTRWIHRRIPDKNYYSNFAKLINNDIRLNRL
ncbi:tetratricopeptide repeat protein [Moorena sp. SIO3I6]|uniref:tetratricopeptide repeat protein n=1 Tax=Moorena sp. SIO3I6 TaxID=2607831 RepID=UPI0025D8C852|nr:tetratricopeptide repeat protein [Moorena sp. SIO3I6]